MKRKRENKSEEDIKENYKFENRCRFKYYKKMKAIAHSVWLTPEELESSKGRLKSTLGRATTTDLNIRVGVNGIYDIPANGRRVPPCPTYYT